ncbi:MAG: 1,4-dihydroxy-2-naphthoate octaprenyltransferase [Rhodothermales bacterium]
MFLVIILFSKIVARQGKWPCGLRKQIRSPTICGHFTRMSSSTPHSPLNLWLQAIRPKTLWAGFAPVLISAALAHADGGFHAGIALACLGVALSLQIGCNLANDYYDAISGADSAERLGPTRVTQAGLISPAAVRRGFVIAFAISAILGVALFFRGGWPILALLVASIASGILYTAGPWPLGYIGLGDLFAFLFFGPVAVAGTYFLITLTLPDHALLAGVAPGLFSVAILSVNNLRDIHSDRAAGKRTLAVRWGARFTRAEYAVAIIGACAVPLGIAHRGGCLACIVLIPGLLSIRALHRKTGAELNAVLANTAKLLLLFSLLFAVGLLL